jgi:hypothetical protein
MVSGADRTKALFLQSLPGAVKIVTWLEKNHPLPLNLKSLPDVFARLAGSRKIPALIPPSDGLYCCHKKFFIQERHTTRYFT